MYARANVYIIYVVQHRTDELAHREHITHSFRLTSTLLTATLYIYLHIART